jgi:hypothetical protein
MEGIGVAVFRAVEYDLFERYEDNNSPFRMGISVYSVVLSKTPSAAEMGELFFNNYLSYFNVGSRQLTPWCLVGCLKTIYSRSRTTKSSDLCFILTTSLMLRCHDSASLHRIPYIKPVNLSQQPIAVTMHSKYNETEHPKTEHLLGGTTGDGDDLTVDLKHD